MVHLLAVIAVLSSAMATDQAIAVQRPMVEWLIPALPTNRPQTPEEAEEGRKSGRKLPPPEVLQPTLDPALPSYVPRQQKLAGTFKGAASDVLAVLAQKWIEKFRAYHPEVDLSVPPPYAGSLGATELVNEHLDFVFVSRELRPDDVRDFKAKFGYDPLSVPVCGGSYRHFGALDAVAFFVNKDNPLEKLTFEQIDAIYSTTRHRGAKAIRNWGDLGLGREWADKPIHVYGIKPWNGFEEFVRERVLARTESAGNGATTSSSRKWSSPWRSTWLTTSTASAIPASPTSTKACGSCRSSPIPEKLRRPRRTRTSRSPRIRSPG